MKILLFVHCFYPKHIYGTEAYTLALAKNLQTLGHQVHVVSNNFAGEARQEKILIQYEHEGVPVISIDQNYFEVHSIKKTYYNEDMMPVHRYIISELRPDIVHVNHLINHTAAVLDVCRELNVRTFGTLTDFFGICLNNKLESATSDLCDGPNRTRSNCVSCYSKDSDSDFGDPAFMRPSGDRRREARLAPLMFRRDERSVMWRKYISDIQQRYDILSAAYETYKCLIAPSRFLSDAYIRHGLRVPIVRTSFGIDIDRRDKPARSLDKLIIGYIGQIAPHKGLHVLLNAVSNLDPNSYELRIWGPRTQNVAYAEEISKSINGLPATWNGTFGTEQTREVLDSVDVLVIPSTWYENSPLILLQALATHTPCIVSDVLGMTEFVEDGISGFAFLRGDSGALRETIRRFIDDRDLARRMSRTTFYSKTSLDMAEEVCEIYSRYN